MQKTSLCGTLLMAMSLSACASIVSDNDTQTYIETEPEVARCELNGKDFQRVVKTPNGLTLPASAAPIAVACKTDGYRTGTATLDTSADGWIIGNAIFGGLIGIAIDAARGAGQKYPPKIVVVLEPASFPNTAARDEWYANRKQKVDSRWKTAIAELETRCQDDSSDMLCQDDLKSAKDKHVKEIEELERHRTEARIVPPAA